MPARTRDHRVINYVFFVAEEVRAVDLLS